MLTDHSKVSIAQIIFYVPAVLLAAWLLFHRHAHRHGQGQGRPRLAWFVLMVFSLVRVVGGIIVILYENQPENISLTVAAIVLLNAGVFPCIAATIGLIWIIIATDFQHDSSLRYGLILSRILFLVGLALLIAGGSLEGNYKNPTDVTTGLKLIRAGYIIIAVFVGCLLAFQVVFWWNVGRLSLSSLTILKGASSAMPFFVVRLTYAFLSIFRPLDLTWSALDGSVAPLVVMALLMEYIVVCIYLLVGFSIPPASANEQRQSVECGNDGVDDDGTSRRMMTAGHALSSKEVTETV
ncbi:hypothetical protein VTN77DRAFT_5170 [Rasamsonia byssochlamydoides]|uniref:uncharacterized protein n=1 Tax=Rasamsonia byssochlamydoides TaxID=89139 RepID=UPI0037445456